MSDMTERSGPETVAPDKAATRPPDRRHQRRWVPVTASLLALLIGLMYIIEGFRTRVLYSHLKHPLHRLTEIAPGLLSLVPRVADVIIGLLLLMLSHGLRRRKRRAWEGVVLLLAASVAIHALSPGRHLVHLAPAAGTVALLVILWLYRKEFYAVGDPRTRWRALWALGGLAVADVAIGFCYISVTHGLEASYTLAQRLQSVIYSIVGFTGPVRFTSETRTDVFMFLMGGLGLVTLVVVGYLVLRPARRGDQLLGDEAVVNAADFTLQGRSMRNVRQMATRVCRHGYVAEIRRAGDIPRAEIDSLIRQADSWRGSPTERGFSMALGRVGARGDENCVIATATENGVLRAILNFVPWGPDGLSLDLMRRDRVAQPGLNDFLIVETIKGAPDLGVKRVSLNFAVFRAALERGERIGAGPVLRAWRGILLFMSRWFQIESLYKFNAKFCPEWVPRFFVFTGTRDIPRIGLAALEAEAFLVWPTVEVRRIARRLGLGMVQRRLRAVARRSRAAA